MKTVPVNLYTLVLLIFIGNYPNSGFSQDTWTTYRLDKTSSDIRILVYKAGVMRFLGHNHVIRATDIDGVIHRNTNAVDEGGFKIQISTAGLVVDDPAERARSGKSFSADIDDESALATRKNMLGKSVLNSLQYPVIHIDGKVTGKNVELEIRIKDQMKKYSVPVDMLVTEQDIKARGRLVINQTDFGIEPFSMFAGMLAVQDAITIEFDINAIIDGSD